MNNGCTLADKSSVTVNLICALRCLHVVLRKVWHVFGSDDWVNDGKNLKITDEVYQYAIRLCENGSRPGQLNDAEGIKELYHDKKLFTDRTDGDMSICWSSTDRNYNSNGHGNFADMEGRACKPGGETEI